jgi:hypothetical protein
VTTNSGNANVTPAPAIHNLPATQGNQGLAIAGEIEAAAQFIIEGFIGQVLIAFGGINIAGFTPFALLSSLGQALVAQANAAYSTANSANSTATAASAKSDSIVDNIINGVTGGSSTGNPVEQLIALFKGLGNDVATAGTTATKAFAFVSQLGAIIQSELQGLTTNPVYVDAEDFLAQAGGAAQALVTTAVGAEAQIALSLVSMFNALTGQAQTVATPAATADQIAALTATTAANAAQIAALQSDADASNNNGMSGGDDLERTSTTDLGTGWAITYTVAGPVLATPNGHDASLILSGTATCIAKAIRRNPLDFQTLSDYQKVTWTISGSVGDYPQFGGSGVYSESSGYGRVNTVTTAGHAPGTVYVRGYADADKVGLFYANGGAEAQLGPYVANKYGAGGTFALICGTVGGLNIYQILYNNSPILTFTDTGLVTQIGANFRGWGFGLGCGAGSPQIAPPTIRGVTVADNFPSPVSGTGFRVIRASTSGTTVAATSAPVTFAANTFDTVDEISLAAAWNGTAYTIPKSGFWMFDLRVDAGGVLAATASSYRLSLWVGSAVKVSGTTTTGYIVNNTIIPNCLHDTWVVYLNAGDVVTPGADCIGANLGIVGNGAGSITYFAGTLVSG